MTLELRADDGESGLQAHWACAQAGDECPYRVA
jgi:hypothetical protein